MPKQSKLDLSPIIKAFEKGRKKLPVQVGQAAVIFFKANITDRQGFLDKRVDPWEQSARAIRDGGLTLLHRGNLLRSIKRNKTTFKEIRVSTVGVNYGTKHNEGIGTKKRQFIGNSFQLEKAMQKKIDRELKGFLKKGGA